MSRSEGPTVPERVVAFLSGKGWTPFCELASAFPPRALSTTHFKRLVEDGTIRRRIASHRPLRYEYRLAEKDETATPTLNPFDVNF